MLSSPRRSDDSSLPEANNLRFNSDDCGEKTKIQPPGMWRPYGDVEGGVHAVVRMGGCSCDTLNA
ncbi:hypothetical protein ES332_D04G051300v1 [Gossypium tomentosum]|uniref:Uncharacterized protein n=1 Tax=Gossypium tomentosum TaxID=34277 RepID=A0A5D2LA04_GOSTO|nr:hypothetical protein ES332_D04G051300v1 [Gossypium tomentosum]